MNLGQLTTRANTLHGFDLTGAQFTELFNEARRRFALRSEYPRKTETTTTVADQAAYAWPSDMLRALRIAVSGEPWSSASPEQAERYATGGQTGLELLDPGVWYDAADTEGVRKLYLYPAPSEAVSLTIEWIYRPVDLSAPSDEPTEMPQEFHPGLLWEVASVYYETVEDNPDLAQRNTEKADKVVGELKQYDNMRRAGDGIFRVGIVGVTA